MKSQQAAEREEQQRIKSLVLNYDLRDEEQDGDLTLPKIENTNIHKQDAGYDPKLTTAFARPDKSSNNRSGQRARKLQLSDVDWYDKCPQSQTYPQAFVNKERYPSGRPPALRNPNRKYSMPARKCEGGRSRGGQYHAQLYEKCPLQQKPIPPIFRSRSDVSIEYQDQFPALLMSSNSMKVDNTACKFKECADHTQNGT